MTLKGILVLTVKYYRRGSFPYEQDSLTDSLSIVSNIGCTHVINSRATARIPTGFARRNYSWWRNVVGEEQLGRLIVRRYYTYTHTHILFCIRDDGITTPSCG